MDPLITYVAQSTCKHVILKQFNHDYHGVSKTDLIEILFRIFIEFCSHVSSKNVLYVACDMSAFMSNMI